MNEPSTFNENATVYKKECRRNKLTPRFKKFKAKRNNHVTIITNRKKQTTKLEEENFKINKNI